jgi:hypothetical protein
VFNQDLKYQKKNKSKIKTHKKIENSLVFFPIFYSPYNKTLKMQTCSICVEKVNRSTHSLIKCLFCGFEACKTCCQTYILDQTQAKCMNSSCGKEWPRKFIATFFPKSFLSGPWKNNREKVLFERELALLPATQIQMEEEKERSRLIKINRKKIDKQLILVNDEIKVFRDHLSNLEQQKIDLKRRWHNQDGMMIPKEKKQFIRACPAGECRGFLSSHWKCGLCDIYTCADCHVPIGKTREDVTHVCKEDDVATAKLLASDTKPCPKCASNIFKIEGCDQMWCTQCHTAFSWKTGKIETVIHNPHFYEWQRQNNGGVAPRVAGDIVCGRELTHHNYRRIEDKFMGSDTDVFLQDVSKVIESVLHLREVQLEHYRVNHAEDNQTLRRQYLKQEITKTVFQQTVQRENKKYEKKKEIAEVLDLFIQTVTDIMYRIELSHPNDFNRPSIFSEIGRIQQYCNECLEEIANTYGSRVKKLVLYNDPFFSDKKEGRITREVLRGEVGKN